MKHFMRQICSVAAVLGLMVGGAGQAKADLEILSNGGFESGALSPWSIGRSFGTPGENWNVESSFVHSGSFAATDVGNEELKQTFAPVAVSTITQVSFWAAHSPGSVTALAYDLFYSDGTDSEFSVNTTGTAFNFFDVTSSLAAGKNLTGFSVFGNSGGTTYLDDASITTASVAVPELSTLISSGIAGLMCIGYGWRRRKAKLAA
jgi:hypothetical protein